MKSRAPDTLAQKIQSPELYRMAVEGTGEKASVIIELEMPPSQVHVEGSPRSGEPIRRRFVEESADQQNAATETVKQATAFLENELGKPPHWLRAAHAFVADVSPSQLRTLADSPLIKAIRLNRRVGT
jgi:hypothetical protein